MVCGAGIAASGTGRWIGAALARVTLRGACRWACLSTDARPKRRCPGRDPAVARRSVRRRTGRRASREHRSRHAGGRRGCPRRRDGLLSSWNRPPPARPGSALPTGCAATRCNWGLSELERRAGRQTRRRRSTDARHTGLTTCGLVIPAFGDHPDAGSQSGRTRIGGKTGETLVRRRPQGSVGAQPVRHPDGHAVGVRHIHHVAEVLLETRDAARRLRIGTEYRA